MGPKKGSTKDATHESVMCPQTGFKMIDPVFVTFKDDYGNEVEMNAHNIENWIDCASKGCNKIAFFYIDLNQLTLAQEMPICITQGNLKFGSCSSSATCANFARKTQPLLFEAEH